MMEQQPCWFCDYEEEGERRSGRPELVLLFACAMNYEVMMSALCAPHRGAMEYIQSLSRKHHSINLAQAQHECEADLQKLMEVRRKATEADAARWADYIEPFAGE